MCRICDKGTQQISSVEFEGYTARVRLESNRLSIS